MVSISHWGMFDPNKTIPFGAAPVQLMSDLYRLKASLETYLVEAPRFVNSGTYQRLNFGKLD